MDTFLPRAATTAAALLAVAALAGCGSSGGSASASSSSSSAGSSSSSPGSTSSSSSSSSAADLGVAKSSLGEIVVNGSKMTTYVFTKDKPGSGTSSCTGQCAALWPPVTTTSAAPKVDGVKGTVGTITLPDGTKQVTLDGRPLYLFAKDTKPGDVAGQGVGKVWYAVGPDGSMLTGGTRGGY
ncbi:COG4315 family predicted lipoprotein [Pedococcus sp. 2YAF34]|uniref:COG4315 family predicted lipoprotein n=1 Tax=Pedococcus sp. 2YAF34 TaxID=3233032 RepID=UPI003F9A893E